MVLIGIGVAVFAVLILIFNILLAAIGALGSSRPSKHDLTPRLVDNNTQKLDFAWSSQKIKKYKELTQSEIVVYCGEQISNDNSFRKFLDDNKIEISNDSYAYGIRERMKKVTYEYEICSGVYDRAHRAILRAINGGFCNLSDTYRVGHIYSCRVDGFELVLAADFFLGKTFGVVPDSNESGIVVSYDLDNYSKVLRKKLSEALLECGDKLASAKNIKRLVAEMGAAKNNGT